MQGHSSALCPGPLHALQSLHAPLAQVGSRGAFTGASSGWFAAHAARARSPLVAPIVDSSRTPVWLAALPSTLLLRLGAQYLPNGVARLFVPNVVAEVGPREVGPREVGPREVCPREVGPRELGPRELGPREVGPREVGPRELGPREVGPREVGPREVGPRE